MCSGGRKLLQSPILDNFPYLLHILDLIPKTLPKLGAITMKLLNLRKRGFVLGSGLKFGIKFALSAGVVH